MQWLYEIFMTNQLNMSSPAHISIHIQFLTVACLLHSSLLGLTRGHQVFILLFSFYTLWWATSSSYLYLVGSKIWGFFLHMYMNCFHTICCQDYPFPHWIALPPLSKVNWPYTRGSIPHVGLFLGSTLFSLTYVLLYVQRMLEPHCLDSCNFVLSLQI